MKGRNPILMVTSIVLVIFLFAPIVLRTLDSHFNRHSNAISITKSSDTPVKSDSQMPFEEKEVEEKGTDHTFNQLLLIHKFTEFTSVVSEINLGYSELRVTGFFGSTPIYLAKRSILI